MRNDLFSWALLAVAFAVGAGILYASKAECAWCLSDSCYSGDHCGPGCVCVTTGSAPVGTCVGIDYGRERADEG